MQLRVVFEICLQTNQLSGTGAVRPLAVYSGCERVLAREHVLSAECVRWVRWWMLLLFLLMVLNGAYQDIDGRE